MAMANSGGLAYTHPMAASSAEVQERLEALFLARHDPAHSE
jgi:hypothetical protein